MRTFALILWICLTLNLGQVLAHGTGASLEKQVGEYLIDVGYDPSTLTAQDIVRFDFDIRKQGDDKFSFQSAWVRIAPKDLPGIIFAGALHKMAFGLTGMSFVFPKPGAYELTVRFENEDKTIAEASFPIEVEGNGQGKTSPQSIAIGGAGLIIGFLASYILKKKTS